MSGLAHMLVNFGARVSGTDRTASSVTHRLSEIGAAISYEETAAALPAGTEIVVHSAAIAATHPELAAAQQMDCEIVKYAQMLGRVMKLKHGVAIAGTHGKSTTTAMTAHVLLVCGERSIVCGGGDLAATGRVSALRLWRFVCGGGVRI